jgi:hypothetical protein
MMLTGMTTHVCGHNIFLLNVGQYNVFTTWHIKSHTGLSFHVPDTGSCDVLN